MLKSRIPTITAAMRPAFNRALANSADLIALEAKARVPVDSGSLRNAIHTDTTHDGVAVIAGDRDAFYGHLVEFGTTRTPPRPFLLPALEARRDETVKHAGAALRRL